MACSTFAQACDALCHERDRVFLLRVSAEYNIPFEELEAKFLVEAEAAIKVPKTKAVRKAKVTVEGQTDAPQCQAQTAKKGQCSFGALKGECFCKRHLKQQNAPKPDVPKAIKPPVKKAAAKVDPVHTHEADAVKHADCDLCQSHGNILEVVQEVEFEEAREIPEVEEEDIGEELEAFVEDSEAESEFDDE